MVLLLGVGEQEKGKMMMQRGVEEGGVNWMMGREVVVVLGWAVLVLVQWWREEEGERGSRMIVVRRR